MPRKLFVCLANSKKLGGRCLAGIEVERSPSSGYSVVSAGWEPKWLRPISSSPHGELSTASTSHLQLLDIVEIDVLREAADSYQSENVIFRTGHLHVIDRLPRTREVLEQFATDPGSKIFGNRGKAVHIDKIDELDHSLMLIKAERVAFHRESTKSGGTQVRAEFECSGTSYDLAITDLDFEAQYLRDPAIAKRFSDYYFTLSLGLEHGEFHTKLIAGVLGV